MRQLYSFDGTDGSDPFATGAADRAGLRADHRKSGAGWNSANSRSQSVSLQALRWELDAVPSTGDGPQQTINKQLVETSDILIAVFWTRLGTPTDVAPSGTAEEIEYFRGQGKPVLLYFSEADVPHDHDLEQLRLLRQYRKTLQANTLFPRS